MMCMIEKMIQKTMLPLPKTYVESPVTSRWASGHPTPCPAPLHTHTHHTNDREEDDNSQTGIGAVGTGVDVWVPFLVQLQHAEPSNHVHEGGVCRTER